MKLKRVLSVLMVSAMFLTGCTSGNSGKQEEKKAEDTKICPHCYNKINIKADRCPYCTSKLNESIENIKNNLNK